MKFSFRHYFKTYFTPQAVVLMYHRVAEVKSDIWDITVSPENFEKQLQLLKQTGKVTPLSELTENVRKNRLKSRSIAITFDDGYADNYLFAKPLLEKYQLPATFFITSSNLGKNNEFWWDELENLILFTPKLPKEFSGSINGEPLLFELQEEACLSPVQKRTNRKWKVCDKAPPNNRCAMFLKLWQLLKPLPHQKQQQELDKLRNWAGTTVNLRTDYQSMSETQLQEISRNPLFEIGAHTVSHAALAFHPPEIQEREICENKNLLGELTGQKIELLSYPYGNYNMQTLQAAGKTKFKAAFTTEEIPVNHRTAQFLMGRFQVKDIDADIFTNKFLK